MVILSASPIPGNEKSISRVINQLFRIGCNVIYESLAEVHVSTTTPSWPSGWACRRTTW